MGEIPLDKCSLVIILRGGGVVKSMLPFLDFFVKIKI